MLAATGRAVASQSSAAICSHNATERQPISASASLASCSSWPAFRSSLNSGSVRQAVRGRRRQVTRCTAGVPPTVADTKAGFIKAYPKPIPNLYNTVLQELIVQHHLTRYNASYKYDPVFALGFVSVFDQLMEGYPSEQDKATIFQAYIQALQEEPEKYRKDASQLEAWTSELSPEKLVAFQDTDGPVESLLKDIAQRAQGTGTDRKFYYNRFFAIGLFRVMELAGASDPATLEKLCAALNVSKMSVDRDLDVYRTLLNRLQMAKDLFRDFLEREKRKEAERAEEKTKASAEAAPSS